MSMVRLLVIIYVIAGDLLFVVVKVGVVDVFVDYAVVTAVQLIVLLQLLMLDFDYFDFVLVVAAAMLSFEMDLHSLLAALEPFDDVYEVLF